MYRLRYADGSTAVRYAWSPTENYWPVPERPEDGPFTGASGLDRFLAAHERLSRLGIRVPRVHEVGASEALVEDVPGGSLEGLLRKDPGAGRAVVDRLGAMLRVMHADPGSVAFSCVDEVSRRALRQAEEAAARVPELAARRPLLLDTLRALAGQVAPRERYGLIHGELGPDHVLVDSTGAPVLIDIEGLMHFDVEWEHVFLALRFGPDYARLRTPDLDEDRLGLYRLAMHVSLVAGPLRLLDGDFPDREPMLAIARYNLGEVLRLLQRT